MWKKTAGMFGGGLALLAIGVSGALAQDIEMECVSALAEQAGVDMSEVASNGVERVGEGSQVSLTIQGKARWHCFVNDAGEVTSLESLDG